MTAPIASSSTSPSPAPFDPSLLSSVNEQLADSTPRQILEWAVDHLPALYQTTAFGLTGLAAIDMLSKIHKKSNGTSRRVPLIFIDTMYHFKETLDLVEKVEKKYGQKVVVYKPKDVESVEDFERVYGEKLWESDEDTYDYVVKVEPARRAYSDLSVLAIITGRRRSQGSDRATLQPIEIDSTGLIKVNPLCRWDFDQVKDYVEMCGVPQNVLLEQGYKSVGDWHSTKVPGVGGEERGGRWSEKGGEKTECGLHKDYFKMKKAFEKKKREADMAAIDKSRGEDNVGESSIELELSGLKI